MPAVALPAPGAFERVRALPFERVLDRLLRGRLCIWVIGVMLGGIVAMQVSLLRMNAGISRAVTSAATLERQNSDFEAAIARATTGDKVRAAALDAGLVDPPAGDTMFLQAHPGADALSAVKRMKPPSESAIQVMANGGTVPNTTVQLAGVASTAPAATPTPAPVQAQPQATPTPTATPVVAAATTTDPGTGAAAAPSG